MTRIKLAWMSLVAGAIALAFLYTYQTGRHAGRNEVRAAQAEAIAKAVADAQAEFERQHAKDQQIISDLESREVEIREVERVVYRDIIRWKAPAGCSDLGHDFWVLFNAANGG